MYSQDGDLDSMWNSTIWNEIVCAHKTSVCEIEYITACACVRGCDAGGEIIIYIGYKNETIRKRKI